MPATLSFTEKCCEADGPCPSQSSLLVFADDWGRHPSSCQHLVRHLLPRHSVTWVNTIGTRTPRLDIATARRGLEKLTQWTRRSSGGVSLPVNLRLLNPRMWPWFGQSLGRRLNRRLLTAQLAPVLASLPNAPVAVTTIPVVSDLMDDLPVSRWVYYCVDDFSQWPGLDSKTLHAMEQRLIERADVLMAVSETLQEKLTRQGRSAHLLTHGVELDHWVAPNNPAPCPQLLGLERPLIVFWGLVDRRMDLAFLQQLDAELKQGTILLVGPSADHDPLLDRIPRVRRLGPVPFDRLPAIAAEASVLIMPYADLPVTRAIQPLKLKEYLATGKPTVVRDLPANRDWADCLDLTSTPECFSKCVRMRLESGLPQEQRQSRGRLVKESWAEKARIFSQWTLGNNQ
jgi:glycosyltransferase involved in cell wall biosynthesis